MPKGNRMSSLPIAQFCPHGPALSQMGSGRAAAQSTAFHASAAGDPKSQQMLALLSEDELQELMTWKKPAPIILDAEQGIVLDYDKAEREITLGLTAEASYCDENDPDCISVGHIDMGWVFEVGGRRIAYVGDMKRSSFTSVEGPKTLQLAAYGFAYADKHGCDAFVRGLWILSDAEWHWEADIVDLNSDEAADLWTRVRAAILNTDGDYGMGAHCHGCYGRKRCPAYLMPLEVAESSLAPLTEHGELTAQTALHLLHVLERAKNTIEPVEKALKAFSTQSGGIHDPESGMWWRPVLMPGRKSLDKDALAKEVGGEIERFMKQGKAYEQHRWCKG